MESTGLAEIRDKEIRDKEIRDRRSEIGDQRSEIIREIRDQRSGSRIEISWESAQ
jgi:hypothetical protein